MADEYKFDLERWKREFPLSRIIEQGQRIPCWSRGAQHITSPVDLVMIEQFREQVDRCRADDGVPCDVFVWALGEPERRDVTKIGGLPYRPADLPWPESDGKPLTFVAQFDFTGSRAIVDSTPGDVLLVFTPEEDFEPLYFEWYDKGIGNLVPAAAIPRPRFEFVTAYGQRYRTADYPASGLDQDYRLCVLEATKIGGIPQSHACPIIRDGQLLEQDLMKLVDGRLLCALGPVQSNPHFAWPFANYPNPLSLDHYNDRDKTLLIYDMGSIFLFLTDAGEVLPWVQGG